MGQYAFSCGLTAPLLGNNNEAICTHYFNINGCAISYTGPRGPAPDFAIINPGVWATSSSPTVKGCPKATSYTNLAYSSVRDTSTTPNQFWDKFVFTTKRAARTPLALK